MWENRQGLIVWFQRRRNIKHLKRFGHLIYASKRRKYAVIYVNQSEVENVEEKLQKLPFVRKVEPSYKPFIRTDYEKKMPVHTKPYDYNVGI
ncbi:MAG TPA: DUF2129 domain-containing protein [Bacillota bacterium]|nr:DUF2129 domain-containing protein [Bacillota bacterium]